LYSKGPFISLLEELGFDYILVAKESDHVGLVSEYIERRIAGKAEEFEETKAGLTQGFCWTNDLPLNATHPNTCTELAEVYELIY